MHFQLKYARYFSALLSLIFICSASSVIAEASKGNPKRGADIYRALCLRCHGEKLDGHGPEAQYLKIAPANLQSLSSRLKSDWELLVILSQGVMFTPMHGYRDLLNEPDMKDILSYIRTEAPFKPLT
jgi:mono/diheme cytochrome c family protein